MPKYQITTADGKKYQITTAEPFKFGGAVKPPREGVGGVAEPIRPSPFEVPASALQPSWTPQPVSRAMDFVEPWRQRTLSAGLGMVNLGLMNVPEIVSQRFLGQRFVPKKAPVAKVVGEMGGLALGMPGKAAGAISGLMKKALPSTKLAAQMAKGAVTGGVYGATMLPTPESEPGEYTRRIKIGATIGGLAPVAAAPFKFVRWLKAKNQIRLAEKARNNLFGQKQAMVDKYGIKYNEIVNRGGRVSTDEPFRNLMENTNNMTRDIQGQFDFNSDLAAGNPGAKKLHNLVRAYMKDPFLPRDMSMREADTLQKYIRQLPGIKAKLAKSYKMGFDQVDWTNPERILLELSNDIKTQVLNMAPEMSILNREYGQVMNSIKFIRPFLRKGQAITNFKNLHKLDPEITDAMKSILPKDIMDSARALNHAERAAFLGKVALGAGAVGGLARYGIYRAIRGISGQEGGGGY